MYEAFYNLSTKPFQLSPDPRFFFNSSVHKRAMSYLRYGLSQGEGFIVITGGVGTGKTTLVRNLFSELDQQQVIAAQLVTTKLMPDELLKMITSAFGLPYEGLTKASLLRQFESFLKKCEFQGKRVLLVVDEAQNLPAETVEELRMLSNFQGEKRSLIQSFLLGQEEFRQTIQSPGMEQMRQRIIASCHLAPLDKKETRLYIEHRLKEVGWSSRPVITDIAFELIHNFTGGVPRRINVFCDRLLLYGYLEELFVFKPEVVNLVAEELASEVSTPSDEYDKFHRAAEPDLAATEEANDSDAETAAAKSSNSRKNTAKKTANAAGNSGTTDVKKHIKHIEVALETMEKTMQEQMDLLRRMVNQLKK